MAVSVGNHLLRSTMTPSALVALHEPGSREVGRSPLDEVLTEILDLGH